MDLSKLHRDYQQNPLGYIRCGNTRQREKPYKEDIIELYINQNISITELAKFFNYNLRMLQRVIAEYGIKKDKSKIRENVEKGMQEKYGVDNVFKLQEFQDKAKETCLEKYGTKHYVQTDEYKVKNLQTRLEKNPDDPYNRTKAKETTLQNYGVDNVFKLQEVKDKIKETCLEQYGTEKYILSDDFKDKSKESCLNKYGVTYYTYSDDFKEKAKETNNKKYGVNYYTETKEFQNLWKNKEFVEKAVAKMYETKMQNNTINSSEPEEIIYDLLCQKYSDVKRQYKSEVYPFPCDFYIPSEDLYIEFQGTWHHGYEPFINSIEHQERLLLWESKESEQYSRAIKTWTINDVKKRTIAKNNNLNWLEFFNLDDFIKWYKI